MARPLARLPLPEPTPAPVDPLAAERFAAARSASGQFARLLLRLSVGQPIPVEAVQPLADLRAVIDDLSVSINDELDALTDAWPELCEIAQSALASLHRMEVSHAS